MTDKTTNPEELTKLVVSLRKAVRANTLARSTVKTATETLRQLSYQYNLIKYPQLKNSFRSVSLNKTAPTHLAEALLWKLGKWPAYKNFIGHHSNTNSEPDDSGFVFYAFAQPPKE